MQSACSSVVSSSGIGRRPRRSSRPLPRTPARASPALGRRPPRQDGPRAARTGPRRQERPPRPEKRRGACGISQGHGAITSSRGQTHGEPSNLCSMLSPGTDILGSIVGEDDALFCARVTAYNSARTASVPSFESQYYRASAHPNVVVNPDTAHDLGTAAPISDAVIIAGHSRSGRGVAAPAGRR